MLSRQRILRSIYRAEKTINENFLKFVVGKGAPTPLKAKKYI
jgi:hypothetical protein